MTSALEQLREKAAQVAEGSSGFPWDIAAAIRAIPLPDSGSALAPDTAELVERLTAMHELVLAEEARKGGVRIYNNHKAKGWPETLLDAGIALTALSADVERLTRERDEALAALKEVAPAAVEFSRRALSLREAE